MNESGDGVSELGFVVADTVAADHCASGLDHLRKAAGENALENCEIENSIVLENSTIAHVDGRIEASLIGKNVKIVRTHRKPAAYRFMLGDNSEVGIT